MAYSFKVSGWPERLWRTNNDADIARGNVPGTAPVTAFGERIVSGSGSGLIRETGVPATLTVPNSIQLTAVSTSSSDIGDVGIRYLDGNLVEQTEVLSLNGLSSVTTTATDIRAINNIYTKYGPANGDITFTSGGVTYAKITTGQLQYRTSLIRIPANKRLMMTGIYAGSASGSSDSRVVVSLVTSFINGDSFANQGYLHPVAAIAIQDSSQTFPNFGPFPVAAGEWVGFEAKWDKAADITAGMFGYMEDA